MRAGIGSALCLALGVADLVALHVVVAPKAFASRRLAERVKVPEAASVAVGVPVTTPVAVPVAVPEPVAVAVPEPAAVAVPEPAAVTVPEPVAVAVPEPAAVAETGAEAPMVSLYFGTDRATIYPAAAAHLDGVAARLAREPDLSLTIVGYADAPGDVDHNLALSRRRVRRVVEALAERGVAPTRLERLARGESTATGAGVSRHDRRVDLLLGAAP